MRSNLIGWEHHHTNQLAADEADQVEWAALKNGSCSYDATHIDDIVSGQLTDYQSESESRAGEVSSSGESIEQLIALRLERQSRETMQAEQRREEATAAVKLEVERRAVVLGECYPFEVKEGSISYRGAGCAAWEAYAFMLELSMDPTREAREEFEKLVSKALKSYLGSHSESRCFGWRSNPEEEAPRRIKGKIAAIYSECGEWVWSPDQDFPDDPPPKLVKDMGLDVMAWIPSPDKRIGQVFLVAQCATGRTDWESKLKDVDWDRITNWVRPLPNNWSVRSFAIPYHVANKGYFLSLSMQAGLFFDRARLTLLLRE